MSFMYQGIKNPTALMGTNSEVIAVFTSQADLKEALKANTLVNSLSPIYDVQEFIDDMNHMWAAKDDEEELRRQRDIVKKMFPKLKVKK